MKDCNNCRKIKTLYVTKHGSVAYCATSTNYHVELVSMLVFFTQKEFDFFCSFIELLDLKSPEKYLKLKSGKIIIQPAMNASYYAFYLEELKELKSLLAGARSMLAIEEDIKEYLG